MVVGQAVTDSAATAFAMGASRRHRKISEVVALQIANNIIGTGLQPGAKLPTEKVMVESFGVGRTTLREALRLLETRGVLTIKAGPHGGPVVRHPKASDLGDSLTLILQFAGSSLRDVLEARQALEPMMARLAGERITPAEIEALQLTVDQIMGNLEDQDVFRDANQRFHTLVAEASGSVVLSVFADTLKTIADGAVAGVTYNTARRKAVATAHQRIVDALRSGDGAAAAQEMLTHLDEAGRYWNRHFADRVASPVHWLQ